MGPGCDDGVPDSDTKGTARCPDEGAWTRADASRAEDDSGGVCRLVRRTELSIWCGSSSRGAKHDKARTNSVAET
jgi:hypothetical protein